MRSRQSICAGYPLTLLCAYLYCCVYYRRSQFTVPETSQEVEKRKETSRSLEHLQREEETYATRERRAIKRTRMVNGLFSLLHGVVVVVAIGAAVTPVTTTTQSRAAISQPPPFSNNNLESADVQVGGATTVEKEIRFELVCVPRVLCHFFLFVSACTGHRYDCVLRTTCCFTAVFGLGLNLLSSLKSPLNPNTTGSGWNC